MVQVAPWQPTDTLVTQGQESTSSPFQVIYRKTVMDSTLDFKNHIANRLFAADKVIEG